jgi:Na+-transporting methylmalonyl-CoA/oxaloacetate decarboxylase gamma subunit
MSSDITLLQAIQISGACMAIVFGTLIIIMWMIDLQKIFFSFVDRFEKKDKNTQTITPITMQTSVRGKTVDQLEDDAEIAVALTAAIEASGGQDMSKVKIVAVRQISE